jgi:N-acetylglutamate synthase/N-acetylornithine aminotransferase
MKKNDSTAAKKVRKTFKKEITAKISDQLKAIIGNIGESKKASKAIEKAAKNLAKKLAKQVDIKTFATAVVTTEPLAKKEATIKPETAPAKTVITKPATPKNPAAPIK